jgi:hypothetical protein
MARLVPKEFPKGEYGRLEKLNGDYFVKVIPSNSSGDFLEPFIPVNYDEVAVTYVTVGNGIGQPETVTYKLDSVTITTLTLTYNSDDCMSGVVKS